MGPHCPDTCERRQKPAAAPVLGLPEKSLHRYFRMFPDTAGTLPCPQHKYIDGAISHLHSNPLFYSGLHPVSGMPPPGVCRTCVPSQKLTDKSARHWRGWIALTRDVRLTLTPVGDAGRREGINPDCSLAGRRFACGAKRAVEPSRHRVKGGLPATAAHRRLHALRVLVVNDAHRTHDRHRPGAPPVGKSACAQGANPIGQSGINTEGFSPQNAFYAHILL